MGIYRSFIKSLFTIATLCLLLLQLFKLDASWVDSEKAVSAILSTAGYEKIYVNADQIQLNDEGIFMVNIAGQTTQADFIGHDQAGTYIQALEPQRCKICNRGDVIGNMCTNFDCSRNKKWGR